MTLPFGFYANSCDPRRKSIGFVVRIVYTTKHCKFKANRIQNLRRIYQTGTLLFRIYASARKRQNVLCGKHMTRNYFKRLVSVSSLGVTFMELMKTGRLLTGSFVFANQLHHFPFMLGAEAWKNKTKEIILRLSNEKYIYFGFIPPSLVAKYEF